MTTETTPPPTEALPGRLRLVVRLDELLFRSPMSLNELADKIGIDRSNLSKLKNGHISMIRVSTIEALCAELKCQVGDLFQVRYVPDTEETTTTT